MADPIPLVTVDRLKKLAPTAQPDLIAAVAAGWPEMVRAGINTPARVAAFIATIATETGGFRVLSENLNYTSVARLRAVWPSRFKSDAAAVPYVRNPEGLANLVYGKRLGNYAANDGWRFRGGGFIQTTGRDNYRAAGHEVDPDALRTPKAGFTAAVKFWSDAKVNALADIGVAKDIRKRVNGGSIGLSEFTAYLTKARKIFTPALDPVSPGKRPVAPTPISQMPPLKVSPPPFNLGPIPSPQAPAGGIIDTPDPETAGDPEKGSGGRVGLWLAGLFAVAVTGGAVWWLNPMGWW